MGYLMNALHLKLVLLLYTAATGQTRPGCNDMCGNVSIPYPFGTSKKCYINKSFFINCTTSTTPSSAQPIAYLTRSNIEVLKISLDPPELIVSAKVSRHCYNSKKRIRWNAMWFSKFSISNTKNRFTVVGCDAYAYISDLDSTFTTGCSLRCSNETNFEEGACSGVGCCETSFPEAIRNYNITLQSFNNYTYVSDFNPCGYAFLAQNGSFNFSPGQDLLNLSTRRFPVVVDWVVANLTCPEAEKDPNFACKENSRCQNSTGGIGHYCVCKEGFRGNPYLSYPDEGCKDINECEEKNRCSRICHNFEGHFKCSCPWGYRGDGYINGSGCRFPIMEISLGISVGLLVIFTLVSTLCWRIKQRALKQH